MRRMRSAVLLVALLALTGAGLPSLLSGLTAPGGGAIAAMAQTPAQTAETRSQPREIVFSILSAEGQASSGPLWEPLLDDMERELGVPVRPFFGANYNVLIEAMRFNQTQVGWFSALPLVQTIDRAQGEVIARTVDTEGSDSYTSTLIVKRGSGITLEDVLRCDRTLDFGLGDAQSTSGTLAPMTFLFSPRNIDPTRCFATVRSANHQANSFAVATGVLDVSTSNSVNAVFLARQSPEIAAQIEEIWRSPPIPESGIVVREDLPQELKDRIERFFLTYGQGTGPEAERERRVLEGLEYSRFAPAENSYLDPIRAMQADQARRERITAAAPPAAAAAGTDSFNPWWVVAGLIALMALAAFALNLRERARARTAAAPATRTAPPEPPQKSAAAWSLDLLLWGGLALVLLVSFDRVDLGNLGRVIENSQNIRTYGRDLLNPDWTNWRQLVEQMWLTVQIALWGTFLAVFLATPLALMAARNISPAWLVWPVRRVMDLLRSIPDLVIGTLFIVAVGLGPLAGVLAIALNTAGVLAKLFSEAVESIDHGPVEGVRATGASRLHEIVWGVLPQVAPLWTSFALYRFESNSRAATVLGLIGAGGIGQLLFESIQAFEYRQVSAIALIIVVAVTLIDMLSQAMRKRLL